MGFFVWKDSFNIGLAEIDRQHRSFLETLNEYYETTVGGGKEPLDRELIDRLKDYATRHFRHEEKLMESAGYHDIERHKKQHRYFESLTLELEAAHVQGKTQTMESTLSFLRDWFLNHILDEDKQVFPSLKEPL